MQQALHIVAKDIRFLYREIILIVALSAILFWASAHGRRGEDVFDILGLLMLIAAEFMVVRLVQAEAVPGHNQFWITRPYHWRSLLLAKLIFVLAFLNLPVFLAQAGTLLVAGFPIGGIAPGLLWTQILILFCIVLPTVALATLTDGLPAFIGCILAITLLIFSVLLFGTWIRVSTPTAMEWLSDTIAFISLLVFALPVLYLQYKSRRTEFSRILAGGIAICGASAYLFLPWQILFPVQSRLSKWRSDVQVVQRTRSRSDPMAQLKLWFESGNQLNVILPIGIVGLPDGVRPQFESVALSLRAPDGKTLRFNPSIANARSFDGTNLIVDPLKWDVRGRQVPDGEFLAAERGRPLTAHAILYFTLFGNTRDRTFQLRRQPTNVMDGLQCYAGFFNQLECRSAFRWPSGIVSQRSGTGLSTLTRLISYSPYPAGLGLNPIARASTSYYSRELPPENRPVTVEVSEPISYLRRDINFPNLYLK